LLVYGFSEVFGVSDYELSNGKNNMSKGSQRMWNPAVADKLRCYPGIYLEGLRKTTKCLTQNSFLKMLSSSAEIKNAWSLTPHRCAYLAFC
jgi:hypothetical protein